MTTKQFEDGVSEDIRRQQQEHEKASQFESASIDAAKVISEIDQLLSTLHDIGESVNNAWDEELEDTELVDVYTTLDQMTNEIYDGLVDKLGVAIKDLENATGKKLKEFDEYIKD